MKKVLLINCWRSSNEIARVLKDRGWQCIHGWSSKQQYSKNFKLIEPWHYSGAQFLDEQVDETYDEILCCDDEGHEELKRLTGRKYMHDRYEVSLNLGEPVYLTSGDEISAIKPRISKGGFDRITVGKNIPVPSGYYRQPFYKGTEYAVDIVVRNQEVALCAVWEYQKFSNEIFRKRYDLLWPQENEDLINSLFEYAKKVVQACHYEYGAAHLEVIQTETGIRLIEANLRLHGSMDFSLLKKSIGYSQVDVLADCLENKKLPELLYRPQFRIREIYIVNEKERLAGSIDWNKISKHSNVGRIFRAQHDFQKVPISAKDYRNILAILVMHASSTEELDTKEREIRALFE